MIDCGHECYDIDTKPNRIFVVPNRREETMTGARAIRAKMISESATSSLRKRSERREKVSTSVNRSQK